MSGSFLGPDYSQHEICRQLAATGVRYELLRDDELITRTARWLASGRAVGWFQGRMEFGPRALGNRSILADPRPPDMQQSLNHQIKFRESFRPFAPVVLAEKARDWFDLPPGSDWPYMLFTAKLRPELLQAPDPAVRGFDRLRQPRSVIPAVTHVDGSARVQMADRLRHPRLHALLSEFDRLTGVPLLVNTSFNVRGEPIVATPTDAWRCFCRTNLPLLVIGNCWIDRASQSPDVCPVSSSPAACPDD
jgi:carbamoyltransferase